MSWYRKSRLFRDCNRLTHMSWLPCAYACTPRSNQIPLDTLIKVLLLLLYVLVKTSLNGVPPPAYEWTEYYKFFLLGGKYGNKLLFASVAVNTTMVLSKTGQTEGLKVYKHWEDFVKQKVCLTQMIHSKLLN